MTPQQLPLTAAAEEKDKDYLTGEKWDAKPSSGAERGQIVKANKKDHEWGLSILSAKKSSNRGQWRGGRRGKGSHQKMGLKSPGKKIEKKKSSRRLSTSLREPQRRQGVKRWKKTTARGPGGR